MKQMKVARGFARAKRRAESTITLTSAGSILAAANDTRSHIRRLTAALYHKAATAKLARKSPFL